MSAVSPGWSTFGSQTIASTVLSNLCGSGGSIGVYVFSNGTAGAVTESGSSGSQVGLALSVPTGTPNVTIRSIQAHVKASSVSGNDAYLGFASHGQALPGLVELPYGKGSYSSTQSWTLPQGARDFEAYVNCSTDHSSPTCQFSDAASVPALSSVTLTLAESSPPSVSSVSGTLVSAAAGAGGVAGYQAISFSAADSDSGVRSAALTLSPQSGASATVRNFDYSGECAYDGWNACPLAQSVSGFTLDTTSLANGTYAVSLSVTDAAGNVVNDPLGSIDVENEASAASPLGAPPGLGGVTPGSAVPPAKVSEPARVNGTGASESAQLRLGTATAFTRDLAHSALRLQGRLLNHDGAPIASAALQVIETVAGRTEAIDEARTAADGTFSVSVPAGPSRTIAINYRALSSDTGYSARATVSEAVTPSVRLKVAPRRTNPKGEITLSGIVQGENGTPGRGVIVVLLVHYRGQWVPFRTPRTDPRGHFAKVYHFQGAVGQFPFRAEVPEGQAGFPYALGRSRVVNVAAR